MASSCAGKQAMVEDKEIEQKIDETVAGYNFTIPESETVDKIKALGEAAIPRLAVLIHAPETETRFIAFIALSGIAHDVEGTRSEIIPYLREGLFDPDMSIRTQVAQILLLFEERDGLPVLIEALDSDEMMIPSEPPMPLAHYANIILINYTDEDYGFDRAQWTGWWDENKNSLQWNGDREKFESQ